LQVGGNILSLIVLVYPKLCQHLKIHDIGLNNKPLKSAVSSTVSQKAILIKSKLHLGNDRCVKFEPSPLGTQTKSVENEVLGENLDEDSGADGIIVKLWFKGLII
jgi:hypothetical protein